MIMKSFAVLTLLAGATAPALAQTAAAEQTDTVVTAKPVTAAERPYGPTQEEMELLAFAARLSQSVLARDNITIGLGAGYVPSYEGSDQHVLFPAPVVRGTYKGYSFGVRGTGLFVDLVKDPILPKVEYIAGPLVKVRLERNNRIRDAVVRSLGKRDIALEAGVSGGIAINRIFGRFDSLTLQTDAIADVSGVYNGAVVTPSISYSTPINTAGVFTLTGSGDIVDNNYADYYYSVTPAGSAASGLPQFRARGGLKSLGVNALLGYDLSGDALDGGWGVFVLGSYSRMQGDAADSPIVSIRGDADQLFGGVGVTYTF